MGEEIEKAVDVKENGKNKRKSKKKIIIPIIIGLVIGLILLFAFSSYKILLSPKKSRFLTLFTSDMYNIKNLLEDVTDNKLVDFITDGKTKKIDVAVNLDSKELSGSTILDKDFLALKLNNINEKYLLVENKKLDKLWDNLELNAESLPSKIDFKDFNVSLTNGEKRKIIKFVANCSSNIVNQLEAENFILHNKKSVDINGETRNLKTIEVKLSELDLLMLQKEAYVALEDEGIVNMLIKKVNKISNSETVNKSEIKEEIKKNIAYLDYSKAYYELEGVESDYYIIYRMYCDEDNNIVVREITEKYNHEGVSYEDVIARVVTDENRFYEIKFFTQDDYDNAYYTIISDVITVNDNKQKHDIVYAIDGFFVEDIVEGEEESFAPVNSSVSYVLNFENDENGVNKISFNDENNIYSLGIEYDLNNVNVKFISDANKLKIDVNVENKAETKESLANDSVIVNNMTQEELVQIIGTTGNKIMEIFAE